MNSIKSFVGSGILSLPYGFLNGGWALSIVSFPLICVVAGYCMMSLVDSKNLLQSFRIRTYADVGRAAFGHIGQLLIQISLIGYQCGCCCSYMIFVTESLNELIPKVKQIYFVPIMIALFLLLSFIRTLKFSAILSIIAIACLLVGIVMVTIIFGVEGKSSGTIAAFNWGTFSVFFGIVLYSFEGIGLVLPIYNQMKKPEHYKKSLVLTLCIVCFLCVTFGLTTYLILLDDTKENITKEIDDKYIFPKDIVISLLIVSIVVSFHILIYPVYEMIDLTSTFRKLKRKKFSLFMFISAFYRLIIIGLISIPSFTALKTHFAYVQGIVGATFGCCISFILPAAIHLRIGWYSISKYRKVADIAVLVFAIPASITVTVISIKKLVDVILHPPVTLLV
ncbi:MAG: amino acid transporter ANTL-1 like [Streblomastix strix]|uniref:Amino acid transporter ANTL-1 like n=1 Tax=Streblomastix strix TaxID=222440 RepID=A0A5J4VLS9_9EUKA|nr:MAG: amino acid transporter ANTL-1 like [Streblomastix strix]